jgi:hypothetical protein
MSRARDPVHFSQIDIHEHDGRLELADTLHSLLAIARFAYHFKIGIA